MTSVGVAQVCAEVKEPSVATTAGASLLEVTSYPPPRAGWGLRVEFLKKQLEAEGHQCVVLNIGTSRAIPSPEYETVRQRARGPKVS